MPAPRPDLDRDLKQRIADSVAMSELRLLVRRELPELFKHLPSDVHTADTVVHETFQLAANHGAEQALRLALQRRWPGLFAPRFVYALIGTGRSLLLAAQITTGGLALLLGLAMAAPGPTHEPDARSAVPTPLPGTCLDTRAIATVIDLPKLRPETGEDLRPLTRRSLSSLTRPLSDALAGCGLAGAHIEVVVTVDAGGVWSRSELPGQSNATRACIVPAVERLRLRHTSTRYPAGAHTRLEIVVPP